MCRTTTWPVAILLVIVNLGVQAIVAWAEKRLLKWRPEVTVR